MIKTGQLRNRGCQFDPQPVGLNGSNLAKPLERGQHPETVVAIFSIGQGLGGRSARPEVGTRVAWLTSLTGRGRARQPSALGASRYHSASDAIAWSGVGRPIPTKESEDVETSSGKWPRTDTRSGRCLKPSWATTSTTESADDVPR